jgi:energy-coupling factor transport system permease protein
MYRPGSGLLYQLNPWTKVCLTLALICLAFLGPGERYLPVGLFLLVVLPLAATSGVSRPILKVTGQVVLPTALALLVAQGLFYPEAKTVLAQWGPLAVKTEGLVFAWVISARLLVMMTAFSLLVLTTSPGALMLDLSRRGLPPAIAYLVVSSIQILPQMRDRAEAITAAQRARGLNTQGSLANRLRGLLPLVSPLIFSALVDSEERAIALQSRAFNSGRKPTSYIEIPDGRGQAALRWGLLLAVAAGLLQRMWR